MKDTHITPEELFGLISEALNADSEAARHKMREVIQMTCKVGLRDTNHTFGNLLSKVDALCLRLKMRPCDTADIHRARRDCFNTGALPPEDTLYDCRALSLLVAATFECPVPPSITGKVPPAGRSIAGKHRVDISYIRCTVAGWDERTISAYDADGGHGKPMTIDYLATPEHIDLRYLRDILREGMQLNLLDCERRGGTVVPHMVVAEPDYLVDISTLANCFEDYGHHPLLYTLNRMKARPNTRHTLLGNFAGRALDEIVNDEDCRPGDILKANFREKALEYATCGDFNPEQFKREMTTQVENIRQYADEMFRHNDRRKAILEPSFVCERLGLTGRADLMTLDKRLLVEQKAGRNIYIERNGRNRHGGLQMEKHYVQVLLYYGMLEHNHGLPDKDTDIKLLYSRYPTPSGLLEVKALKGLLREAIKLRNMVVAQEYGIARDGFGQVLDNLSAETLNTVGDDSFFYNRYLRPQIEAVTTPLRDMDDTTRAYFCRMMKFVAKEQLMSKVGGQDGLGNSAADLWNMPLQEKVETGNIYTGMTILRLDKSDPHGGYDTVSLNVPEQGGGFLPNFRRGDMVYLYTYTEGETPDARHSILFRGVMADMRENSIVVRLNDGQRNSKVFDGRNDTPGKTLYAIEHGSSDMGGTAATHSLFELATASADRRELILSRREPRRDETKRLTRSYHKDYDDMVLKAKQASDFFLLIGPPGTGKTSMAMRFMVEEQLTTDPRCSVLLMSYTNRAVDEICSMLREAGIDFLRLGGEFSCDPQFRDSLIGSMVGEDSTLASLKARIADTRVVVATTSALAAKPFIFALKRFALAVVDEAGQITEPNIVGLLAAHDETGGATPYIDKFILIGDYKQLPAVVQQDERESAVEEPLLRDIGLHDCRDSLFERLARRERGAGRTNFIGVLRRQGRMHPDVAEFPAMMFYNDEKLTTVPLRHQLDGETGYTQPSADSTDDMLKRHRVVFVPSADCRTEGPSEKVNTDEARIVAELLERISRLLGDRFDAMKSVGVIVPYRNQIATIRREMAKRGFTEPERVSIDTVERYQGAQRDIIIYSFTIHRRYQLEFLTANRIVEDGRTVDRKLNVAMTRAKKQMIVTGNPAVIGHDPIFRQLMEHIRRKGGVVELDKGQKAHE